MSTCLVRMWMCVVALGCALAWPAESLGQETGSITGSVTDSSGGAMIGAKVTARDAAAVVRLTVTGSDGSFAITGLTPGTYVVEASRELFDTASATVSVAAGQAGSPLTLVLQVSGLSESVSVGAPKVDERPTGQIVTSMDRSLVKDIAGFSISEIMTFSPGVTVQQANGPRDVVISVRGSNARATFGLRNIQVFEDGFNVTQPDGLARTDLVDPHAYGRIDVARGPSSSLYGNYAIEGAINFQTRRPEEINGIEVGQDLGSFGYRNTYVTYGKKLERFEIMAFGSGVAGNGFTTHTNYTTLTANVLATFTPSEKNKFVFKFINNDMYPNLSIRLSLDQYEKNPYQRGCEVAATGVNCSTASLFLNGVTGTRANFSATELGAQRHDRRTIVGARWERLLNTQTTWRTQVVWDVKDIKQPGGATGGIGTTPSFILLSDVTSKGTLGGKPAVHFIGGTANFLNSNSVTYNIMPGGNATLGALTANTYGHVSNFGLRAREEVSLSRVVIVSGGLGVERTELMGKNTGYTYSATAAPTVRRTEALRTFVNVAPEATLVVKPNRTVRVQARVGSAYGTPQASNLFVTPDGVNGNNTELKSQSNIGVDTGVDLTTRFVSLEAAGYYEWYRNELLSQSPGVNLLSYTFNAPRSIHKGFELSADTQILGMALPGARVRASYTWMNQVYDDYVERISAGAFSREFDRKGNTIPGITPNNVTVRAGYDHPYGRTAGLGGHVEWMYRDDTLLDNANQIAAPGYTLWNLNLHYDGRFNGRSSRTFHLLFEIRNLTDKVWVSSAGNLSNTLNATTGEQNGVAVLRTTTGSILAGTPRTIFTGVRVGL